MKAARPSPASESATGTGPAAVYITGADGFIGRALAEHYRSQRTEVRGMDQHANADHGVVFGDISTPGAWQAHATGCELFIHTAAVVSNTASAEAYRRTTVAGTRHAVDAAVAAGCRRFIHLSSIAAYGVDIIGAVDERDPVTVLSGLPYCDAKAASEQVALAAHAAREIEVTIIRPGDVYGPGSRPWVLMPLTLMRRRAFVLPAHGKGIFSPVFIDNLVDGIALAAASKAAAGHIFNITDGAGIACTDFFTHHWRWLGHKGAPPALPTALALPLTALVHRLSRLFRQETEISQASARMLARRGTYSVEKARAMLGYAPTTSLADGLERTRQWLAAEGRI